MQASKQVLYYHSSALSRASMTAMLHCEHLLEASAAMTVSKLLPPVGIKIGVPKMPDLEVFIISGSILRSFSPCTQAAVNVVNC